MQRTIFALILLPTLGCGASTYDSEVASEAARKPAAEGADADPTLAAGAQAALERKIIYEAHVQLVVDQLAPLEARMAKLVQDHDGYLATVQVDRTHGRRLSGRWIARIPVSEYDTFLSEVMELGVPERFDQNAQDVTEEYVDLQARIGNKKQLEERILELLERPEGEIKDVIEVERELARVREEVERMEGRLRYLENRTSLTTVTVEAIERDAYTPSQAPTFAGRAGHTWSSSMTLLRQSAANLALAVIFLLPWFTLLLVCIIPLAWIGRVFLRHRR